MHAIAAAVAPNESNNLPADIQWMPPGEHEITASRNGKPHTLTMQVKPEHALLVNSRLQQMRAAADAGTGDRPFLDLNHDDREASAHPTEAFWGGEDPQTGGIRLRVNWTGAGERAVRGKDYSRFSPSFYPDKAGNVVNVPVNMGGLVNRAAFQKIQSVVRSKSAGAEGDPAEQQPEGNQTTVMKSLLAVLAKLGLTTSAEVDEATAVTQVTAKHSELTQAASAATNELTQVKAKLATTETALTTAQEAHATSVVEAAIQAGRIPGQDDKVKAKWVGLIKADPTNASLLPEPNPALQQVVSAKGKGGAENKTSGGAEHEFLVSAKAYQTEHKVSEAFAFQKVAAKNPELYESYRTSLGLGGNGKN